MDAIHKVLKSQLPLDAIYTCYHGQDGECDCRKPKPGLLKQAALDNDINLSDSYMVGDRWKDIDVGNAAGCQTILIDYEYQENLLSKPNYTTYNLNNAAKWILDNNGHD